MLENKTKHVLQALQKFRIEGEMILNQYTKTVYLNEIRKNDYNLNISPYMIMIKSEETTTQR